MEEPILKQNNQVIKARTIQMYDSQQISHTLEIQSSRIAGSNQSIMNQQSQKKKKKRYFKEDADLNLQRFNGSYNDDFESPVQSKYINQSQQVSSFDSLSKYSLSKERSKNGEKTLSNQEINKLFMKTNSSQKVKKNDLLKTKVYVDQYMNNRNEIENSQSSSIEYEQPSVNNQKFTENSRNQTIASYQTKQGEIYTKQMNGSKSPDRESDKSQYKIDEFDFKQTLAKVHKINAYEPKVYKQLQLPNYYHHSNKLSTASTQQDYVTPQRYQLESETTISYQNENQSPRNSHPNSLRQYQLGQSKKKDNIEEINSLSSSNHNNNLVYRKKRKLKKKNLNIDQNDQTDITQEYENMEQNIQPDGSFRVEANKFLLSNRGSQMQVYATPSNIQKILNSTKQVRRKSFVFHNSPRMIKNTYGVNQNDIQLIKLRDQFKEKVKEIQEFNKNHTNNNFYKRTKQISSNVTRAQSPTGMLQTQNGFHKTPKQQGDNKQNKSFNLQEMNNFNSYLQEENNQSKTNAIQMQHPSSSYSKKRRKSYNHPSRLQQIQLPQVLQNTQGQNTPHEQHYIQNHEPNDQLFSYVSSNLPKNIDNQPQEEKNQQNNDQKIVMPIRSKTPNIKISKSRNSSKNNSPKRFTNISKLKNQYNPPQQIQNSPRNKQL